MNNLYVLPILEYRCRCEYQMAHLENGNLTCRNRHCEFYNIPFEEPPQELIRLERKKA